MTNYWTDDVLPPMASPQRVLSRWIAAGVCLLGVGFGLGWVVGGAEEPSAAASCPCPLERSADLRIMTVAVPLDDRGADAINTDAADSAQLSVGVTDGTPINKAIPVTPKKALNQ